MSTSFSILEQNVVTLMEKIDEQSLELNNVHQRLQNEEENSKQLKLAVKAKEDFIQSSSESNKKILEEALSKLEECKLVKEECNERVKNEIVIKLNSVKKEVEDAEERENQRSQTGTSGGITNLSKNDLLKIKRGNKRIAEIEKELNNII